MATAEDYYDVLMVARDAGPAEIRTAFRELIARWHPDRSTAADAHARSAAIIDAYRTLSRPDRRRAYDDRRRSARIVPPGAERRRHDRRNAGSRRRVRRALTLLWAGAALTAVLATAGPLIEPADDLSDGLVRDLASAGPAWRSSPTQPPVRRAGRLRDFTRPLSADPIRRE